MRLRSLLFWLTTVVVLLVFVLPLVWLYLTSFKTLGDIYSTDVKKLMFFSPSLRTYFYIFSGGKEFFRELLNTMVVAVSSTILVIVAGRLNMQFSTIR